MQLPMLRVVGAFPALGPCLALAILSSSVSGMPGDEEAKLLAPNGAPGDAFGAAVVVAGTWVVVGAPGDDDGFDDAGTAQVFELGTNQFVHELAAPTPEAGGAFGSALSASGSTVLVGAPLQDDLGVDSGAAFLFDAETGQLLLQLVPVGGVPGDQFGCAVALHGNTAVVGADERDTVGGGSGAVHVFDATTGVQRFELAPAQLGGSDGFGSSVALWGSTLVVGAEGDDDQGNNAGAVYVLDAETGDLRGKIVGPSGGTNDGFGDSVAIFQDVFLIGIPGEDDLGPSSGAAFLYDTSTLLLIVKLYANDTFQYDGFGASVAMDGTLAVVGAPFENNQAYRSGSVYLFDTASHQQIAKLGASDAQAYDNMGRAVAISGDVALAGAVDVGETDTEPGHGAAYVFSTSHTIAVPYCFGTGTGTPCPCGNAGVLGRGCANGSFAEGARLWGERCPSVAADDLRLRVEGSPPHQPGLFFQGDEALNGGQGLTFGDGLRCAGGAVLRLEVDAANASGRSATTIDLAATAGLSAGDTKRYQWWYRDPAAGPCGNGFNLSNGLEVVWGP